MVALRKPFVFGVDSNADTSRAGRLTLGKRALVRNRPLRGIDHCPRCHSDEIIKWGSKDGNRRFRCNQCERTFTTLTNTELAHLRHRERWISFIGAMVEDKSLRESAAICGVSLGTAQRWRNRLVGYMAQHGPLGLALLDMIQQTLDRL